MIVDNANAPSGTRTQLRNLRLEAGLSQERLARLADCSTSTVRLAERGWLPSPTIVSRLALALGCTSDDLTPPAAHVATRVVDVAERPELTPNDHDPGTSRAAEELGADAAQYPE